MLPRGCILQAFDTFPGAGTPDPQLVDVATIKVPILLQSGSEDGMKGLSDPDTIEKTADKIKSAGGDITLHIYDGARPWCLGSQRVACGSVVHRARL